MTFPFEQVEGLKLRPVFLLRDAEQYYQLPTTRSTALQNW